MLIVTPSGPTKSHAFRIPPKYPLKKSLLQCAETIFARDKDCSSLFITTVVGSLCGVKLRLANASKKAIIDREGLISSMGGSNDVKEWVDERFEIVSLTGTFCRDGSCHLHLAIADADGNAFGGHLLEASIFTTAEVVLGSAGGIEFIREVDDQTGYKELTVRQIQRNNDYMIWAKEFSKISLAVFTGFMLGVTLIQKRKI